MFYTYSDYAKNPPVVDGPKHHDDSAQSLAIALILLLA